MKKLLFIFICCFCLFGCGGSSSDNTENKEAHVYNIAKEERLEPGYQKAFSIKGRDNKGNSYTGSVRSVVLGPSFLDDIPVIEEKMITELAQAGSSSISSIYYNYYKENGDSYKSINQDGSFDLVLVQSGLPDEVKIGDFGPGPTIKTSSGKTTTSTWQALDGGNGNLKLVKTTKYKDSQTNIVQSTSYYRPDGTQIKETRIIYLENNLILTLDYLPVY